MQPGLGLFMNSVWPGLQLQTTIAHLYKTCDTMHKQIFDETLVIHLLTNYITLRAMQIHASCTYYLNHSWKQL